MTHTTDHHGDKVDAILADRGLPFQWLDPSSHFYQRQLGLSQRQIVNTCKREGWPWQKFGKRVWVCADFADRYEAKYGKPCAEK